jgi:hypothetical protein
VQTKDGYFKILYLVISVFYLILCLHLPVGILVGAMHDDALFWKNAQQIVAGDWLGKTYNQYILAKGAGYPLIEALNYIVGLPITLTLGLIYLIACILVKDTLEKLNFNKYFVFLFFLLLLYHPQIFPVRIIRDNIYQALSLISILAFFRILFLNESSRIKIMLLGLALFFFWITREEGIWIAPTAILFIGVKILLDYKDRLNLKKSFYNLFLLFSSFIALILVICSINYFNYGKFQTVDFKDSNFEAALTAMYSVRMGPSVPYVPVPLQVRNKLYEASPKFKELQKYFEGDGQGWTTHGCHWYPHTCGDFAAGWFVWALRDNVATLGYYDSPKKASEFYRQLAGEISSACAQGLLECKKSFIGLMPGINADQWKNFIPTFISGFKRMGLVDGQEVTQDSWGSYSDISDIRDFLGGPLTSRPVDDTLFVNGWAHSKNGNWIQFACAAGERSNGFFVPRRLASPDVVKSLGRTYDDARFSIELKKSDNCTINFLGNPEKKLNINELVGKNGLYKISENMEIYFDNINYKNQNITTQNHYLKFKIFLINFYKKFAYLINILSIFSFPFLVLYVFISKKNRFYFQLVFAAGLWLAVLSRLTILTLIDISSFPGIQNYYLGPAFPISLLASLTISATLIQLIFRRKK